MRDYMPPKHLEYLRYVEQHCNLQTIVRAYGDTEVTESFNEVIRDLLTFRSVHYRMVHEYIWKFVNEVSVYVCVCGVCM